MIFTTNFLHSIKGKLPPHYTRCIYWKECGLWLVITGIRQRRLYCLKGKTQGITSEIQFTAIIAAFANLPGRSINLVEAGSKQTYIPVSLGLIRKFSLYMGNKTNDQIVLLRQITQQSHKWVRTISHTCCINGPDSRERIYTGCETVCMLFNESQIIITSEDTSHLCLLWARN